MIAGLIVELKRQIVQRFNTAYRMSMLSNKNLIAGFLSGTMNGRKNGSMSVSDDGRRLFSYATCIAERADNCIVINETRYSVTTSKQQGILRRMVSGNIYYVNNIERGDDHLVIYLN